MAVERMRSSEAGLTMVARLFVVLYAWAAALLAWGVEPKRVLGFGVAGEAAALSATGSVGLGAAVEHVTKQGSTAGAWMVRLCGPAHQAQRVAAQARVSAVRTGPLEHAVVVRQLSHVTDGINGITK